MEINEQRQGIFEGKNRIQHHYILLLKCNTTTERNVKDYRQTSQHNEECCRIYQKKIYHQSPTKEKIKKYMQTDINNRNK